MRTHIFDCHPYTAAILSSPSAIRELKPFVAQLMRERDITVEPLFFLAAVSSAWTPRAVVVRRDGDVAGIVYAKERRWAGVPTGLVCLDGRLGNMVAADPADVEDVLCVAIQALFAMRRVVELRLLIPPSGLEERAIARAGAIMNLDFGCSTPDPHTRLRLPADYDQFLEFLGYKTRRNFRYYRRKFDEAGHAYLAELSMPEVHHAVAALRSKCRIPSRRSEIQRALNVTAAVDRPWAVGLKHRNGEWLSVAAGWYGAEQATMFFQLNNDREHAEASLSVVLRARLIETLIGRGTRELVFWSGSAPPLSRYATGIPAIGLHLDSRTPVWRLARFAIRIAGRHLSKWMDTDLRDAGSAAIVNPRGHAV
jgi:hypothetical protein